MHLFALLSLNARLAVSPMLNDALCGCTTLTCRLRQPQLQGFLVIRLPSHVNLVRV